MKILLNQQTLELPAGSTLADALQAGAFTPPFAVALNTCFVPRSAYPQTPLRELDRVEVITPVTGG